MVLCLQFLLVQVYLAAVPSWKYLSVLPLLIAPILPIPLYVCTVCLDRLSTGPGRLHSVYCPGKASLFMDWNFGPNWAQGSFLGQGILPKKVIINTKPYPGGITSGEVSAKLFFAPNLGKRELRFKFRRKILEGNPENGTLLG